jgi:PilZ domain
MPPSDGIRDVRKNPRYPVEVRVRVCFSKNGFLQRATVKALDISATGISLISPLALPNNASVEVELTLPGVKTPLRVKSVIRNRCGARYGVEFLSTTEFQKNDITNFGNGRKPASKVENESTSLDAVN